MKLLRELNEGVEYIVESSESGSKKHYLSGVFMEGGVVNRNGRIYEPDVLRPEVERFNKEIVKENRGFGELGHPAGPTINLDRVCVIIKEISENGSQYKGKALVTETPMGQIVKGLLEGGAKLGVSSRALGSLKEGAGNYKGAMVVQPDLKLITVDVVADPSAPNAFVEGIMESKEWVEDKMGGWKIMEVAETIKKKVKKMNVREINENKIRLFEDFLASVLIEGKEELLYPPTVSGGKPYELYHRTMKKNKVGDVVTAHYGAPGTGYVQHKITRMDKTGVYARKVKDTGRILTPGEVK